MNYRELTPNRSDKPWSNTDKAHEAIKTTSTNHTGKILSQKEQNIRTYLARTLQKFYDRKRELLFDPYATLYDEWVKYVNQSLKEGELENIRNSVNRQSPLGQEQWQIKTATKYGMLSTLRRRGRPSL